MASDLVVKGDVSTERLMIEDGAKIEGKIFTGGIQKGGVQPASNSKVIQKDKETKDPADMVY